MQGSEAWCRVEGVGFRGKGWPVVGVLVTPPPHDGREALGLGFESEGLVFVI